MKRSDVPRHIRKQVLERDKVFIECIGEYQYFCYLCGRPVEKRDISLDHVIPYRQTKTHDVDNLKITHRECNAMKN